MRPSTRDVVDHLYVVDVDDPAYGSVVIEADHTLTYTHDLDFTGTDTFNYRMARRRRPRRRSQRDHWHFQRPQ
jgi:hypothetical protein